MSRTVFSTPWFNISEEQGPEQDKPHYVINAPDFAVVVATDESGRLLLVRQHRVAMNAMTLELPAGHVDPGETPEQTARKELLEETGYEAEKFELLATLAPSTARFTNRMWIFFAARARLAANAAAFMETGMNLVVYERGWRSLLNEPEFYAAPSCAALFAALAKGKV